MRTTTILALAWGCNGGEDECPLWDEPEVVGSISSGHLDEPSGLVTSPLEPDVLWTHNDAGDDARLFALAPSGEILQEFLVSGVTMGDWEDVALEGSTLWVGDLGLDGASPPVLFSVALPVVGAGSDDDGVLNPETILGVTFPDLRPDVEAMFYDEPSGEMILTTRAEGDLTSVYAADLGTGEASAIATLVFGEGALAGDDEVTGGAATADGSAFALRTRTGAFVWERESGDIADVFADVTPCPVDTGPTVGGEAIAFDGDRQLYAIADGAEAVIVHLER